MGGGVSEEGLQYGGCRVGQLPPDGKEEELLQGDAWPASWQLRGYRWPLDQAEVSVSW